MSLAPVQSASQPCASLIAGRLDVFTAPGKREWAQYPGRKVIPPPTSATDSPGLWAVRESKGGWPKGLIAINMFEDLHSCPPLQTSVDPHYFRNATLDQRLHAIASLQTSVTATRFVVTHFGDTGCGELVHSAAVGGASYLLKCVGNLVVRSGGGGPSEDLPYVSMDTVNGGLRAWALHNLKEDGAQAARLVERLLALANVTVWVRSVSPSAFEDRRSNKPSDSRYYCTLLLLLLLLRRRLINNNGDPRLGLELGTRTDADTYADRGLGIFFALTVVSLAARRPRAAPSQPVAGRNAGRRRRVRRVRHQGAHPDARRRASRLVRQAHKSPLRAVAAPGTK